MAVTVRSYSEPENEEIAAELRYLDSIAEKTPRWCDTCESKIVDVAGETTCWRCRQKAGAA